MFKSKARKMAEQQLKIEAEKKRIQEKQRLKEEQMANRPVTTMAEDFAVVIAVFNWLKARPKVAIGIAAATLVIGLPMCGAIIENAEQQQIAQEKERLAREQRQQQIAADIQKAEAEQAKLDAKEAAEFKSTYGFDSIEAFQSECRDLIAAESGSTTFGVFNTKTFEYESAGSLVMQQSVYGKNAFGTKVENRFKCWSQGGTVSAELIEVNFQ